MRYHRVFTVPCWVGLGTYLSTNPDVLSTAVKTAIRCGYRHIDTAYVYDNEAIIGSALKDLFEEGAIKREEVFVTTKLPSAHHRPEHVIPVLKKQLKSLQLEYVDLYLIHNPRSFKYCETSHFPTDENGNVLLDIDTKLERTWQCLEECVNAGLVQSIGVSNTNQLQLERILKCCTIKPAMNQIESHPYFQNDQLIKFCNSHHIGVTAYAPFGAGRADRLLENQTLLAIAKQYSKTVPQVCLRWQLQRGNMVIPKSNTPSRITENFDVWDFELSDEDMQAIAKLDTNVRLFKGDFKGAKLHPEYPFIELL